MHLASFQLPNLSERVPAGDYTQLTCNKSPKWRAAVFVPIQGGILAVQHQKKDKLYWLPPGGGVDKGETCIEGGVREVEEETSIICRVTHLLYVREPDDHNAVEFFMLGEHISGTPTFLDDTEHDQHLVNVDILSYATLANNDALIFYPAGIRQRLHDDIQNPPEQAIYLGSMA